MQIPTYAPMPSWSVPYLAALVVLAGEAAEHMPLDDLLSHQDLVDQAAPVLVRALPAGAEASWLPRSGDPVPIGTVEYPQGAWEASCECVRLLLAGLPDMGAYGAWRRGTSVVALSYDAGANLFGVAQQTDDGWNWLCAYTARPAIAG